LRNAIDVLELFTRKEKALACAAHRSTWPGQSSVPEPMHARAAQRPHRRLPPATFDCSVAIGFPQVKPGARPAQPSRTTGNARPHREFRETPDCDMLENRIEVGHVVTARSGFRVFNVVGGLILRMASSVAMPRGASAGTRFASCCLRRWTTSISLADADGLTRSLEENTGASASEAIVPSGG